MQITENRKVERTDSQHDKNTPDEQSSIEATLKEIKRPPHRCDWPPCKKKFKTLKKLDRHQVMFHWEIKNCECSLFTCNINKCGII